MKTLPAKPQAAQHRDRPDALVESYRRLAQVFHHVLSEQSVDALLARIAGTLAELVPHDALTLYEADERSRRLQPVLARDPYRAEILEKEPAFGEGITGWAVEHRQPVWTNNAQLDPRASVVPGTPVEEREALICVPLVARGALKGALNIYRLGGEAAFDEEEFELAKWFGDAAALALDNAQIRARLEHQAQTDSLTDLYNHRTFHERLRAELARASRAGDTLALLMLDIDDFKRVNDVLGHGEGDRLLVHVADVLQATARVSDVVCRVGGEEFALILPSCDASAAEGLVRRLRERLRMAPVDTFGPVTVSVGVAVGPKDAINARELVACAEAAMMTAKAQGKDRVVLFDERAQERPEEPSPQRDVRSIAHLKMLQSLARKLSTLTDVHAIAGAIVDELRLLIDYHGCTIHVVEGRRAVPVAIRGFDADADALRLEVGAGLAGWVLKAGRSALVANVREDERWLQADGDAVDESAICAPLSSGGRVLGAITVSKLGVGQFDEDDLRLLEVVCGQAAVSFQNARLYDTLRREAQNAKTWLDFSDAVSEAGTVAEICGEAVRRIAQVLDVRRSSLWLEDPEDGTYRCVAGHGYDEDPGAEAIPRYRPTRAALAPILDGRKGSLVLGAEDVRHHFFGDDPSLDLAASAISPLPPGYGVRGWLAVTSPNDDPLYFTDERLRLLEGFAFRASVAMQRALLYRAQQENAETANALLEYARQLAAADGYAELTGRMVELAARMLGSTRASLWIETSDDRCRLEAAWRGDGRPLEIPVGQSYAIGEARRMLDRTQPFLIEPSKVAAFDQLPPLDESFAVAPLALGGGRVGVLAVALPRLDDRRFRLLAGMANQAVLALAAGRV